MNQDEQQLDLLAVFQYIVAGLIALCACMPLMYVGLGILLLTNTMQANRDARPMGWVFIAMGTMMALSGWALALVVLWAGRKLKRRQAYQFCFVIACIECVFMPFGTVLGVFTILVLSRESVKRIFAASTSLAP